MSSSPGSGRPGSAAGPATVLSAVRQTALASADALMQHVPDTGDHATGHAVDAFVERAADALRALAEAVGETLVGVDVSDRRSAPAADQEPVDPLGAEVGRPPRGRGW